MPLLRNCKINKIVQVLTLCVSILYPLGIVFKSQYTREILLIMIIFWWINTMLEKDYNKKIRNAGVCIFFAIVLISGSKELSYFYPIIVSFIFLCIFLYSLKGEAIITKIAKLKEKDLNQKVISYTRNLTKVWIGFFIINIIICAYLLTFENKNYWAYYSSFISYILMGLLFVGEFIFRKIFIKKDICV